MDRPGEPTNHPIAVDAAELRSLRWENAELRQVNEEILHLLDALFGELLREDWPSDNCRSDIATPGSIV